MKTGGLPTGDLYFLCNPLVPCHADLPILSGTFNAAILDSYNEESALIEAYPIV